MEIIHSQPRDGAFSSLIFEQLKANRFRCYNKFAFLVAYAKKSGVDRLAPYLEQFIGAGGTVTAVVGIDQKNTTSEALSELLRVGVTVFVFHDENLTLTYHPKMYLASKKAERAWISIGSSNLTAGGLFSNYEINATGTLDLTNRDARTQFGEAETIFAHYSDTNDVCCKKLTPGLIVELLEEGYIFDEETAKKNFVNAARTHRATARRKIFGSRGITEPLAKMSTFGKAAKSIVSLASARGGFWKKLSHWDVSLTSSPGQIQIPIQFMKNFPQLSDPLFMESGATQSDVFFDVFFVARNKKREHLGNVRLILYEPAPTHKRPNIELRFTFRNHNVLRSLSAGDYLVFQRLAHTDAWFEILHLSATVGAARFTEKTNYASL